MIRKITERIGANWLFLASVCLLYIAIGLFDSQTALGGLQVFWQLLQKIAPILGVVFGLLFFSNLVIERKTVVRYLGKEGEKGGWLLAIVAGILSAGPVYLWYPLLSDFKQKGMRDALIATFLYNRAVKIPLLPMMIYYFGLRLVVVLTTYMVLFSVLNGYLVERILSRGGKGE
jgi:uncharacterized membrane protein YraQ (UPF0718 family)